MAKMRLRRQWCYCCCQKNIVVANSLNQGDIKRWNRKAVQPTLKRLKAHRLLPIHGWLICRARDYCEDDDDGGQNFCQVSRVLWVTGAPPPTTGALGLADEKASRQRAPPCWCTHGQVDGRERTRTNDLSDMPSHQTKPQEASNTTTPQQSTMTKLSFRLSTIFLSLAIKTSLHCCTLSPCPSLPT
jgi:hypothetical protein